MLSFEGNRNAGVALSENELDTPVLVEGQWPRSASLKPNNKKFNFLFYFVFFVFLYFFGPAAGKGVFERCITQYQIGCYSC